MYEAPYNSELWLGKAHDAAMEPNYSDHMVQIFEKESSQMIIILIGSFLECLLLGEFGDSSEVCVFLVLLLSLGRQFLS